MGRSTAGTLIIVGVVLAVLGLAGIAVPYFTTQQTKDVAKLGDLRIQSTQNTPHSIPPLLSEGVLALGVILLGAGVMQRRA